MRTSLCSRLPLAAPMLLGICAAAAVGGVSCTDSGLQPFQAPPPATLDDKLQIHTSVCTSPAVDVMTRCAGSGSVQFGVIAFDARIDVLTDGFVANPDVGMISSRLSMADRLTDYQGALGAAYSMLSEDMQKSSPAERARSKY